MKQEHVIQAWGESHHWKPLEDPDVETSKHLTAAIINMFKN